MSGDFTLFLMLLLFWATQPTLLNYHQAVLLISRAWNLEVSKASPPMWSNSICFWGGRKKATLNLRRCNIFSCAFRARNMQTKCGVIFPPTSRRNPSSKSWNCQPSPPWVKSPPSLFTLLTGREIKKKGSEQRRDWCRCPWRRHFWKSEQEDSFYFGREQLSRCPAEPSSTDVGRPRCRCFWLPRRFQGSSAGGDTFLPSLFVLCSPQKIIFLYICI